MTNPGEILVPGRRVTVTQQIPQRNEVWTTRVTGEVVCFIQRATGSWFAHGKDSKLWLDRLTLRKEDGEIVECVMDPYTRVDVTPEATPEASPAAPEPLSPDPEAPSDTETEKPDPETAESESTAGVTQKAAPETAPEASSESPKSA